MDERIDVGSCRIKHVVRRRLENNNNHVGYLSCCHAHSSQKPQEGRMEYVCEYQDCAFAASRVRVLMAHYTEVHDGRHPPKLESNPESGDQQDDDAATQQIKCFASQSEFDTWHDLFEAR
eukprot:m.216793 g.216793  ORF g.216793 m.216793 type:complete len:120 (-) comp16984_c1_seq45:2562-2921(-)